MRRKTILAVAMAGIFILVLGGAGEARAQLKVGDEAPSFTLPSSHDTLVDYYKEYYGKHHLVMTFFPAAFTPT